MTPGNVEFLRLERSALLCGLGFTQKVLKASTTGSHDSGSQESDFPTSHSPLTALRPMRRLVW